MDLQDLLPALDVGQAHIDLPVEPAGTQQGGVQDILAVGGRHDDDALVAGKAVHLHQQLVQGLLALVVAAAQACAALTAYRVDLVDEHDGRGFLLGLVKEVADTAGAHAYVQLHKVGARDGQEVDSGLARHRLGDQGLTGARRANQQHALGDACAQSGEALGVPEKLHDLLQLLLLLVGARHIVEGDLLALVGQGAGAGVAEAVGTGAAATAAGGALTQEEHVGKPRHHQDNQQVGQILIPPGALHAHGIVIVLNDSLGALLVDELMQVVVKDIEIGQLIGDGGGVVALSTYRHGEHVVLYGEVFDLLLLKQGANLAVGGIVGPVHLLQGVHRKEGEQQKQQVQGQIPWAKALQGTHFLSGGWGWRSANRHTPWGWIPPLRISKGLSPRRLRVSGCRCRAGCGSARRSPGRSPPRRRRGW